MIPKPRAQPAGSPSSYARPPIVEAVIEMRVTPDPNLSVDALARTVPVDDREYPKRAKHYQPTASFTVGTIVGSMAHQEHDGYMFSTEPEKHLLITSRTVFSCSRVSSYAGWDQLVAETRKQWERYRVLAAPQAVTRVSVRYVNRLILNKPFSDFSEYLLTLPEMPDTLDNGLSSFAMKLELPQDDIGAHLILSEATELPQKDGSLPVVLDIDLIMPLENIAPDSTDIWANLEVLRHRKNEVFEACITEKMRKEFF